MSDEAKFTLPSGPNTCRGLLGSTCGAAVSHPGICSNCGRRRVQAEAREACERALRSIPIGLRWARFADSELALQVGAGAVAAARRAVAEHHSIAIAGGTSDGRSELAAACLAAVVDRGIFSGSERLLAIATGARFVTAADLHGTRRVADRQHLRRLALAPFLVLDGVDRVTGAVAHLLDDRAARKALTVLSTGLPATKIPTLPRGVVVDLDALDKPATVARIREQIAAFGGGRR